MPPLTDGGLVEHILGQNFPDWKYLVYKFGPRKRGS